MVQTGLLRLTFTQHHLSPLAVFSLPMHTFFTMEGGGSGFTKFTVPTLRVFLKVCSQSVWQQARTCCLCYRMLQNAFFPFSHNILVSWEAMQRHCFSIQSQSSGQLGSNAKTLFFHSVTIFWSAGKQCKDTVFPFSHNLLVSWEAMQRHCFSIQSQSSGQLGSNAKTLFFHSVTIFWSAGKQCKDTVFPFSHNLLVSWEAMQRHCFSILRHFPL